MPATADLERVFRRHRRDVWGLAYRVTGVAADADEVVQDAFVHALEQAPLPSDEDWRRWLVRVATNLSLDRLRARRRRPYVGPWLPAPVETPDPAADAGAPLDEVMAGRESVSYAFLVALERLAPRARAVLVLRDVLDHPADEVAAIVGISVANVRVIHHRARRTLAAARLPDRPLREVAVETRRVLARLVDCFVRQDVAGLTALLAPRVRSVTDGGGEFTALRTPLVGVGRVVRFHLQTARRRLPRSRSAIRCVNGVPALVVDTVPATRAMASRLVLRVELAADGRIRELQTILASRKLTGVRFDDEGAVRAVEA